MKAIILSRVSTQSQDLAQQTELVRAEALKDGFSQENLIIIEDKESAVKLSEAERNGINQMKHFIEQGNVSTVYTYEISRISRQPAMLYNIRDYLIKHHVQLVVLNPQMRMLNDDGTLSTVANILWSVFSGLSENECYLRRQRCMRGIENKKKSLEHVGGHVPFGYALDANHHYIIDEKNADLVRRIYSEYINGTSINCIAAQLQSEGFKADRTYWTVVNLCFEILHRKYYAGDWKHPAIITQSIYDAAQAKCQVQRTYNGGSVKTSLLKGILRNKETGHLMSAKYSSGQYICKKHGNVIVKMSVINMIVAGVAREWHNVIYNVKREEYERNIRTLIEQNKRVVAQQEKNIIDKQDKIDRINERYIEGHISKEKADILERKVFEQLQVYKCKFTNANSEVRRLTELLESKQVMTDIRDIVVDVVNKIYLERLASRVMRAEIHNKHTGEIRTIEFHSVSGNIIKMTVKLRDSLNYVEQ